MTMNQADFSMSALLADPRMGPCPPKPLVIARVRYVLQWLWFPALWALWLVPYLVLVFLYFTVFFPFAFVWDVDLPGPPGTGRRLRALFDGRAPVFMGGQSGGTTWRHRDGRVEIDDSYFRRLGVARGTHGWRTNERGLSSAPPAGSCSTHPEPISNRAT
ncbi:hypothetical protein [Streptomyces sp. NPDC005435]|uniref:hypothetical protein n=1 Tax=Streptomyces sp. NPDC005435 TaxID=3154464 RepID=UPI003457330F